MQLTNSLINLPPGDDGSVRLPPPGQTHAYPSPTSTGHIPFTVPSYGTKTETWYALYGHLSANTVPLICLHGGPGMGHNYLKPLAHLSTGPHARPVILYDQLGCGRSTRRRDLRG